MRERLTLLPGWSIGTTALEPLREALLEHAPHLTVEVAPLPALEQAHHWLDELDARLPRDGWLAGWSLGGMLAAQLAARRGDACRGLIGLCSNPSFRDRDDWPAAMPSNTFAAFHAACLLDPAQTLKRFTLLVAQGARDARTLSRQLQISQPPSAPSVLDAGLCLLDTLDTRDALRAFAGPQLHLFAGDDTLVPASAAQALLDWLPDVETQVFPGASHGLPLERPDDVAAAILAFIHEGDHD